MGGATIAPVVKAELVRSQDACVWYHPVGEVPGRYHVELYLSDESPAFAFAYGVPVSAPHQ